ncbi:Rieske 2Fe-2S domain-containing protein [Fulvivirga sp.]|uniref:Rieske (2Fe-2S) protein n=1 Tax=Fulvivirga sp. TaxID=1931237 RepID=UPI0032EEF4DB
MKLYKVFESEAAANDTISPQSAVLLQIGNKRLCMARHNDGYFVTDDKCPHNGESLSKGKVNYLGEIICPWHNYRFSLKHGVECERRTHDLTTYSVESREDGIFVGISD